jgi:hypothetical protein
MNLQEKMFAEVENWTTTKVPKLIFLEGKEYNEAKFNFWLAKWKACFTSFFRS